MWGSCVARLRQSTKIKNPSKQDLPTNPKSSLSAARTWLEAGRSQHHLNQKRDDLLPNCIRIQLDQIIWSITIPSIIFFKKLITWYLLSFFRKVTNIPTGVIHKPWKSLGFWFKCFFWLCLPQNKDRIFQHNQTRYGFEMSCQM